MSSRLVAAARLLSDRGVFGLVWLDGDLIARERFGRFADWVPLGEPILRSVPALVGCEDAILSLAERPRDRFEITNIAICRTAAEAPRFNLTVFWDPPAGCYMMLLSRVLAQNDLGLELTRVGRKLMAQAEDLDRANRELTRANQDLDQFASIISHDLKAPLRALRFLAEELAGDLGELASEAALDRLGQIHEQATRMRNMLSALLEYSRVGRKEKAVATVDTCALVREIVRSLALPVSMRVVVEGDWPTIDTLQAPLDLVLRNLIDNAVKHHDRSRGRIRLSATEASGGWHFAVTDDGPGIAPGHHAAVFEPFRKVDMESKPESTGMGLALVRRAVERLGGSISLISDPARGRGTTFRVFWPRVIKHDHASAH